MDALMVVIAKNFRVEPLQVFPCAVAAVAVLAFGATIFKRSGSDVKDVSLETTERAEVA
jgi:hypothetical protein